jgi:hypothetical protein
VRHRSADAPDTRLPNPYVIYYGWLADDERGTPNDVARRIAAARVPLLVAAYWSEPRTHRSLSDEVLALMRAAGTRVFAYVRTGWGAADLQQVKASASEYLAGGADGIFLDECSNFLDSSWLLYYRALAQFVRGAGKALIVNPGVSRCGEDIMSVADHVMVEHEWRSFAALSPWRSRYPPERFMAVSSNEESGMGYPLERARAIEDTREAWTAGIGWHTSTDRYITLPEWFDDYMAAVTAQARVRSP